MSVEIASFRLILYNIKNNAFNTLIFLNPDVRLVDGSYPSEGRVEVYSNGTWGTVTDDYFGSTGAQVVCRSLGYGGAVSRDYCCSIYGQGIGSILMDDVDCTGNEDSIFDCKSTSGPVSSAYHNKDVGVRCQGTAHAESTGANE